jgi:CBS domain-containing protein
MTRNPATVTEDTPLKEVARLMETRQIKRVPVVRDGRLVGIVARADMLRALMQNLRTGTQTDAARRARLTEIERQSWLHRTRP